MESEPLPRGWSWATLGSLASPSGRAIVSGPFGSNIGSRFFVRQGVPVIRGNNLTADLRRFLDDGFVFLTSAKAEELGNCDAVADDLVFTAAGSLGQVGLIPKAAKYARYIISNKQMRARLDRLRINPLFAFYWFASPRMVQYVQRRNTGSSVPLINLSVLRSLPIPVPPLVAQDAIARVLASFDDKIELNRRLSETLESMARALFKCWFVDFEPVRSMAEGRAPGLPHKIADLFPARLIESPVGEIPHGWRVDSLQTVLAEIEVGGRPKGGVSSYSKGVPSIGAESIVGLGKFDYSKTKYVPREFFDSMTKGHVRSRDILLYKDGGRPGEFEPHLTMIGDGFPFEECAINEHVYRLRAVPEFGQNLLFFWLSSDPVMEEMRIKGTGVAIPGLNSTQARSLTTLIPPPEVARAFNEAVEPWIARILVCCNESRALSMLRDALLPKLVSGELRMPPHE